MGPSIGSAFLVYDKTGGFSAGLQIYSTGTGANNPFKIDPGRNRAGLFVDYTKGSETAALFLFEVEKDQGADVWFSVYPGNAAPTAYAVASPHFYTFTGTGRYAIPISLSATPGSFLFGSRMRIGTNFTGTTNGTTSIKLHVAPMTE